MTTTALVQAGAGSSPHIVSGGNFLKGDDYAQMIVDLDAARALLGNDVRGELYTAGVVSDGNLIASWVYDASLDEYKPASTINLERVTDTHQTTIIEDLSIGGNGLGVELHTPANAAADPAGNEADATTGWTGTNATVASISDPSVGAFSLEGTAGTGSNPFLQHITSATVGNDLRVSIDSKRGATGVNQQIASWSGFEVPDSPAIVIASGAYQSDVIIAKATLVAPTIRFVVGLGGGHNGESVIWDNVSIREAFPTNVITVADASAFTFGELIAIFRPSNATGIAVDRKILNVDIPGGHITFSGAGVVVRPLDVVQSQNEMGGLNDQASGGLFAPSVGVVPDWTDGIGFVPSGVEGEHVVMGFAGNPGAVAIPRRWMIDGVMDFDESGAGTDSAIGVGTSSPFEMFGACLVRVGGTWRRGAFSGAKFAPSFGVTSTSGTPGSQVDATMGVNIDKVDGTTVSYTTAVAGGTLNTGTPVQANNVTASGIGWGVDGPPDGVLLLAQVQGGGSINNLRLKQLTSELVN